MQKGTMVLYTHLFFPIRLMRTGEDGCRDGSCSSDQEGWLMFSLAQRPTVPHLNGLVTVDGPNQGGLR